MPKNPSSQSGFSNPRVLTAFAFCAIGTWLALLSFAAAPSSGVANAARQTATSLLSPTFGHPVISGIGGNGYEVDLRLDPTDPNRIYTSAPGALSANTSWIWRSLDGGRTFKWVAGATPFEGKVTTCFGGGDTELAVDSGGHLYFNDLTIANFSTARSDDDGSSFECSNTGVPDAVIDRQWYAVDGDPTDGGILYLANNENGPGGVTCSGGTTANNVLVMYRSPYLGAGATAGIEFGPVKKVTADLSCDSGLPGNNEISPVATTLGQPDGSGGFATLSAPVKHVYVIHDDAAHDQIRMGRCFPVGFGQAVPNVSDPSGLNCTDLLVADMGASIRVGATFPSMAIDKAGNLYAVWQQAPIDGTGQIIGDTTLHYSYSTDQGNTWAAPLQIDTSGSPVGVLHNNVFGWVAAGDDGRIDIAWYGTPGTAPIPSSGPDSCACDWSLWMVQSLNAHGPNPTFTAPILASEHFTHRGTIWTFIGGQNGDRHLGDFLQLRVGPLGEAQISYADSNNAVGTVAVHAMYVRQNGGEGLYAATSPVNIPGLTPFNSVTDPAGDGTYEAGGTISSNMSNLDIIASSVSTLTTAPCSVDAPCYRVVMQLNDLSLAPDPTNDPDPDLVWLTQWFVPSTTDAHGGKNFFVYAESTAGAAVQCFAGENHAMRNSDWFVLTYPGNPTALPAANCSIVPGANGTVSIDVPISLVTVADPIDDRLHEVTASTMTLEAPASATYPPVGAYGGSLFNLIDIAPPYIFNPNPGPVQLNSVFSRKTHGSAGTFDIPLPLSGTPGIECRGTGSTNNTYTLIFTFANNLNTGVGTSATVTAHDPGNGTGSVGSSAIGPNPNQYTVNLTGISTGQHITVTLNNVVDSAGNSSSNVVGPQMGVLVGDVNQDKFVLSGDYTATRQKSGTRVDSNTFKFDVNADGFTLSGDYTTTRQLSGTQLPQSP